MDLEKAGQISLLYYLSWVAQRIGARVYGLRESNHRGATLDNVNAKRPRGRPFGKGNPGRKRGSKNKATLLTGSLTGEQGEELLGKAYEMAMGGNVALMKFFLDRILPKERPIQLNLPSLDSAHDSIYAMAEIIEAVSTGRISPREAADVGQLVCTFVRAIQTTEVETELEVLRRKLDPAKVALDMVYAEANGKASLSE